MHDDGNDFLMRGGNPSVKFPVLGSTVIGAVTKPIKVMDVTDPATGEVKRWSNGDPKKQVVIELQTELRESEDDDGSRTLWAKGQMVPAIRDAVQRAGAKGIMPGSILQVTWSDEKPSSQRGLQAQKIYAARYWPPEQVPQEVPPSPGDRPAAPQQYHQPAAGSAAVLPAAAADSVAAGGGSVRAAAGDGGGASGDACPAAGAAAVAGVGSAGCAAGWSAGLVPGSVAADQCCPAAVSGAARAGPECSGPVPG
jgi:hypothetical protein